MYVLKSAGDQIVSSPIQLEYAVSILVTHWATSYPFSYWTQIWPFKINKNMYDQC